MKLFRAVISSGGDDEETVYVVAVDYATAKAFLLISDYDTHWMSDHNRKIESLAEVSERLLIQR